MQEKSVNAYPIKSTNKSSLRPILVSLANECYVYLYSQMEKFKGEKMNDNKTYDEIVKLRVKIISFHQGGLKAHG